MFRTTEELKKDQNYLRIGERLTRFAEQHSLSNNQLADLIGYGVDA